MSHLVAAAWLYGALVAEVALRGGPLDPWTPAPLLIAALAASRRTGGVAWAAAAGLLCDCLSGRPLGVTMLVATLAVTAARHLSGSPFPAAGWARVVQTFAFVLVVEAASRALTGSVSSATDHPGELAAAFRTATATAAVSAAGLTIFRSAVAAGLGVVRGGADHRAAPAPRR